MTLPARCMQQLKPPPPPPRPPAIPNVHPDLSSFLTFSIWTLIERDLRFVKVIFGDITHSICELLVSFHQSWSSFLSDFFFSLLPLISPLGKSMCLLLFRPSEQDVKLLFVPSPPLSLLPRIQLVPSSLLNWNYSSRKLSLVLLITFYRYCCRRNYCQFPRCPLFFSDTGAGCCYCICLDHSLYSRCVPTHFFFPWKIAPLVKQWSTFSRNSAELFGRCSFQYHAAWLWLPDRTFHNFSASKSGDLRMVCSSGMSYDGFLSSKVVKGSVGWNIKCSKTGSFSRYFIFD